MGVRRSLILLFAALLSLSALTVAPIANASSVRPADGVYSGTLHSGVVKVVSLKVSGHGTTAVLNLICNGTPIPYRALRMSVVHGAFHAKHQLSPGLSWGITGRFTTRTKASAHFDGQGVCDGRSGNVALAALKTPPTHPTSGVHPSDGTYRATLSTGVVKVISLAVSQQGTTAVLSLTCDGTPIPYPPLSMAIVNGAFHAIHQLSPGISWGITGQFSTPTTASAQFDGQGVCDGRSGNVALAP
jgi:hypothetical protein